MDKPVNHKFTITIFENCILNFQEKTAEPNVERISALHALTW